MKKISKAVALILTLALMLTILAACGGGTTTQSQAPPDQRTRDRSTGKQCAQRRGAGSGHPSVGLHPALRKYG